MDQKMTTLLEQALRTNDVPSGTVGKGMWKDWTRLQRPKGTKCPFGKVHKKNRNICIRECPDGYQIRCFGSDCNGLTLNRNCETSQTWVDDLNVGIPVYTADMF